MSLPKIEIRNGDRITYPPRVIVDGWTVPGVTAVQFEHAGMMLGQVTLTVLTDDYNVVFDGLPFVRPGRSRVVEVREARLKRRQYARCQL